MIFNKHQQKMAEKIDLNISKSFWKDWKWQTRHRINSLEVLESLLDIKLSTEKHSQLKKTIEKFPMSITPYYLSLINTDQLENDPIFRQAVPSIQELDFTNSEMSDPLHEDKDSPVPLITHRYPDRILFLISNVCAMYCRHCTRKRIVGDIDNIPTKKEILVGIDYIRNNPKIRDVLLSGGDPFLLPTEYLNWILTELRKIEHVEIIRIGTRTPVVLPYRIDNELV
ncbi:MAG: KamA family radical SAM protein, partial [Candidatus Pacearchaeota archaeon]|nr:KamA family radical SAM protein [Candidatus Pacearchaeota archaeon]